MATIRILHLSTAHPPQDPRIVFKLCPTLADHYTVFCALPRVSPGLVDGIRFIRLPFFRRVVWRTLLTGPLILWHCLRIRPRLVHVYVPDFIPFALLLHWCGVTVVYEVQENLARKLHLKTINNVWLLKQAFRWFDGLARRHFYVVLTEHGYRHTYTNLVKPHVVIYNYPLLPMLNPFRRPYAPDPTAPVLFYVGLLSFDRAFDTLLTALAQLKETYPAFVMHLFGQPTFSDAQLRALPAYEAIKNNLCFYGYTDQRLAFPYAANATAGLALLKPVGDYPESYPTKLFEYMALGLPVVTSDFPLYRDVVERHQCGFCLSPYDATGLTEALIYLIEHPDEARRMGERGRTAVDMHYQWTTEGRKLLDFYRLILGQGPLER